jgi:Uma2 family endonuclease
MGMSAGTLISLAEYLNTSYSPDMEFRDGVLVERNAGDEPHADVQTALGAYIRRRRREWKINVYTELRIRVRAHWYPIPDVCIYPAPKFEGRYPSEPPLLWIEILSHDDRMVDVWAKADELIANGVPYVWIIDPNTLESELRTADGLEPVPNRTLRLPNSPIVIPLDDVMAE